MPKLLLFCSGTLIRLATGFWVALANAAVSLAAGVAEAAGAFAAGFTGASCAATESVEIAITSEATDCRRQALLVMSILSTNHYPVRGDCKLPKLPERTHFFVPPESAFRPPQPRASGRRATVCAQMRTWGITSSSKVQ